MNNQGKPKYCDECENFEPEDDPVGLLFDGGGENKGKCKPNDMKVYGVDKACPWGIKKVKTNGK